MPRRQDVANANRIRILDAADRLFQERGFAATTVREIAALSGLSVGSVMHTGDKTSLLVQLFDSLIAAGHVQTARITDASTCAERVAELVHPFVALFTARLDLSRVYASTLVSGTHDSTLFGELAAVLVDEMERAITQHGCTSADDARAQSAALYFAYIGVLFSASAQAEITESSLMASLRPTFAAICTCKEEKER